jgi:hypothetical protein
MLRARFTGITRWLIRSRRFRHGHLLVVMLAAVSSAEAPIDFLDSSPAVTSAGPTAPIAYNTSRKEASPKSPIDDLPWSKSDLFIDQVQSKSPPQTERVLSAMNLGASDSLFQFQRLIDQQTGDNNTTPSQLDPSPAAAIDGSISDNSAGSGVANDFSFGGGGGTTSTPGQPVISTPSTPVPEPSQVWLIAVSLLGLCRTRGNR